MNKSKLSVWMVQILVKSFEPLEISVSSDLFLNESDSIEKYENEINAFLNSEYEDSYSLINPNDDDGQCSDLDVLDPDKSEITLYNNVREESVIISRLLCDVT